MLILDASNMSKATTLHTNWFGAFRLNKILQYSVLLLTLFVLSEADKYSTDPEHITQLMKEIRPFRMKKANLLWTYGRKVFNY